MQRFFLPAPLTLSLLLISCNPPTVEAPATESPVADATRDEPSTSSIALVPGEQVEQANRIVALTSLSADLVQNLAPNKLVGVPGSRLIRGDKRFQGITPVSEERVPPNLETIVSLEPDLVIGAVGFHYQALQRLQELKVPTLAVEIKGWEELERLTQELAARLGADPKSLQNRYQACLTHSDQASQSILVLSGQAPILSPNKASWAGNMLTALGVKNVAAELQGDSPFEGYITLSPEKILKADPERIILIDTADGAIEALKTQDFWEQLSAVKQDQVHSFDYYGLVNPGSIGSVETACQKLKNL